MSEAQNVGVAEDSGSTANLESDPVRLKHILSFGSS
jgi:hypothetical protein